MPKLGNAGNSAERAVYGTWIRQGKIVRYWSISAGFLGLALILAGVLALMAGSGKLQEGLGILKPVLGAAAGLIAITGLLFAYIATFITLVSWRFASAGGDWQNRIHQFIIDRVVQVQSGLDIGCGNGHLVITAAKRFPGAKFAGIDYWGKDWEYSIGRCRRNAELESVPAIAFRQASASRLPYANDAFDLVISCLTFHEVGDVPDRSACLTEALRVLAPGGRFVFFDLFDETEFWPDPAAIRRAIGAAGGNLVQDKRFIDEQTLPWPLAGHRVLGGARILVGTKS